MSQPEIVEPVIQQHTDDAAFLWLLRDAAVAAPHYSLDDLTALDDRLSAHIDGLRVAGDGGWRLCEKALAIQEPGEVFAAAIVALDALDGQRLDTVIKAARQSRQTWRALVSAFGWLDLDRAEGWLGTMSRSSRIEYQMLATAGSAVHRMDPGPALSGAIESRITDLRARALRAVGELGRRDLLPGLRARFADTHDGSRFWALWSAVLLGDRSALGPLTTFITFDSSADFSARALQIGLRAMALPDAHNWLKGLATDAARVRDVLIGCGIVGDPRYVPWLIKQMQVPENARVAAEAFSMITGLDIANEDFDADSPDGFEAGPTEEPADENVALDPDEDLPWPDSARLQGWWATHKGRFQAGLRYLVGAPVSVDQCRHLLRHGLQRRRNAAALELALLAPHEPLFETRAPAFRQRQWLRSGGMSSNVDPRSARC
jgi:uncharacterized protein (TIGR02270 family)